MTENAQAPDYVGAFAGARAWRVAPNLWAKQLGLLWAMAMTNPWPDAELKVAECARRGSIRAVARPGA